MPYFEAHKSDYLETTRQGFSEPLPVYNSINIERSYRSRAPRNRDFVKVVPDHIADPHAGNLSRIFSEKLAVVGASENYGSVQIRKDRGHTRDIFDYKKYGSKMTGVIKSRKHGTVLSDLSAFHLAHWNPSRGFNGYASLSSSSLEAWGQKAYASSAEGFFRFDMMRFLGELREGLPKLASDTLRHGAHFYKGLGSDYLNAKFGWEPFISDLQGFAKALAEASGSLKPYSAHRVRGMRPIEVVANATTQPGVPFVTSILPSGFPPPYLRPGMRQITNSGAANRGMRYEFTAGFSEETHRWFEGEFSFFPYLTSDPDNFLARYTSLMRKDITPSTLWELAPWSWMVDWFADIGSTISANEFAQNPSIISSYAYAMETITHKYYSSVTVEDNPADSYYTYVGPRAFYQVIEITRKRRIRANPFGFNPVTNTSLNPGQWAILGALGVSRR